MRRPRSEGVSAFRTIRAMPAVVLVLSCAVCAGAATQTRTFGVFDVAFHNSGDSDGYLTGEQDWTEQQMQDVGAALQVWQDGILNTPGRQVRVHMFWKELDSLGTNVLGGSASYVIANSQTRWNLGEYVWKESSDPGTTTYGFDTVIQYDITAAGVSWNFSSDSPSGSEIDFRSLVAHEIGHSLGFSTTYDYPYDDWGWFGTKYAGLTAWDKHLVDSKGNKPASGSSGTPKDFDETDDPVYWDGSYAVAYYGGLVPIYAPKPFQSGSSLTHVDESTFPGALMSPGISLGEMVRQPGDLEWAVMRDMGWNIVPEPGTAGLLLVGLVCLWRRNSRPSQA